MQIFPRFNRSEVTKHHQIVFLLTFDRYDVYNSLLSKVHDMGRSWGCVYLRETQTASTHSDRSTSSLRTRPFQVLPEHIRNPLLQRISLQYLQRIKNRMNLPHCSYTCAVWLIDPWLLNNLYFSDAGGYSFLQMFLSHTELTARNIWS